MALQYLFFFIINYFVQDVQITEEDYNQTLDLRPYMNPSPYTVKPVSYIS